MPTKFVIKPNFLFSKDFRPAKSHAASHFKIRRFQFLPFAQWPEQKTATILVLQTHKYLSVAISHDK